MISRSRLPLVLALGALLWPAAGAASSKFRLLSAKLEQQDLVVEVALTRTHGKVDFFAHATQPRHSCDKKDKGPLIRDGFLLGSLAAGKKGDFTHTFRVPLADVQAAQPIAPGKELYIAANWPCSTNSGAGHQWGGKLNNETARITGTHCVLEASKNSALGLRLRCAAPGRRWLDSRPLPWLRPRPASGWRPR